MTRQPHHIMGVSFILHGRETSVTAEPEFMEELKVIAAREKVPLREIFERIEVHRLELGPVNRSRAVRVYVLKDLQRRLVAAEERFKAAVEKDRLEATCQNK